MPFAPPALEAEEFKPPPIDSEETFTPPSLEAEEGKAQPRPGVPSEFQMRPATPEERDFTARQQSDAGKWWQDLNTPILEVTPTGGRVGGYATEDPAKVAEAQRIRTEGMPEEKIALGLRSGADEFLSGLTTPISLGTLGAAGILRGVPVVSRVLSGWFSVHTGKTLAVDTAQELGREYAKLPEDRDQAKLTQLWTGAALNAPLAAALGTHAVRGETPLLTPGRPTRADHLRNLGLEPDATPEQIKTAFRTMAKEVHPDVNPDPAATAEFQKILESYTALTPPKSTPSPEGEGRGEGAPREGFKPPPPKPDVEQPASEVGRVAPRAPSEPSTPPDPLSPLTMRSQRAVLIPPGAPLPTLPAGDVLDTHTIPEVGTFIFATGRETPESIQAAVSQGRTEELFAPPGPIERDIQGETPSGSRPSTLAARLPERPPDIIDDLQGLVGGKLSLSSALEHAEDFTPTAALKDLFSKTGGMGLDDALAELHRNGLHRRVENEGDLIDALQRATAVRKNWKPDQKQQATAEAARAEEEVEFAPFETNNPKPLQRPGEAATGQPVPAPEGAAQPERAPLSGSTEAETPAIRPLFSEDNRLVNLSPTGGTMSAIRRENPEFNPAQETVTIYRATVGNELRVNDYVALKQSVATDHLRLLKDRGEKGQVIKAVVPVADLLMANDATEFIYYPKPAAETFETARSVSAAPQSDTFSSPGLSYSDKGPDPTSGYAPGTPVLKAPTPITLGGMSHVRPMEMPELVKMAQDLMGSTPSVRKLRGARGMFKAADAGSITLDPSIFANSIDAAKTLAHEIGHLDDYLPDKTLARGNLLGRLYTLKKFLKDSFGGGGAVKNKDLRAELIALSQFWKPYPATAPGNYIKYRESSAELYADALSVLFNSPGLLQQMAPKFWREFWKELKRKPEVEAAILDVQDLLNKGQVSVLDQRANRIEAMFKAGEETLIRKAAERELRRKSWKGYWLELKQQIFDTFEPVIQKTRQAEKAGAKFKATEDPRNILEQGPMVDNTNTRFVRRMFEGVIKPVEDAGLTVEQLGQYLFLRRVMAERGQLANPLGFTPETARQQMLKMRLDLGMPQTTLLKIAVQKFHDLVFESIKEAVRVGSYSREMFTNVIAPNKDIYAAFAVLDYLEDFVPAGVKSQIGTLKEIANPFTATVLKTLALNNLNTRQRSLNVTRDMLLREFPSEVEKAPETKGFQNRPPPKPDKGILTLLEDGHPAHYYVDPLIAHAFEHLPTQSLHRVTRVLDAVFRKGFYKLYITYSPSFLLFNPVRDFSRTWKNLPLQSGLIPLAKAYLGTFREAVQHVRGIPGPLAHEMMANYAIGVPYQTMVRGDRDDQFGDLLRRYHLLPEKEQSAFWESNIMAPIRAIDEGFKFFGSLQETLPKFAGYHLATRELGMKPQAAGAYVRNYVGTPNVFKKGRSANVVRSVVPFFNIFAQGARADLHRMKPKSGSGWWFRWAATDGIWAVLAGLAGAGLLGAALKELFGGVSEYDKTNYNTLPIGWTGGGEFGKRVQYLRIPRDEQSRVLSGLTYKLTRLLAGDSPEDWTALLDFGAGQIPSVNPAVTVPEKWLEYTSGHNPEDPFRGRPIIPRTEFEAGGLDSLKPMFKWTIDQSGAGNYVKWNDQAQTTTELALSAIPGLNKIYKTSDQGYREQQQAIEKNEDQLRAQLRLAMPDNARSLLLEYSRLRSLDPQNRTPEQTTRYTQLSVWYNAFYLPISEAATAIHDVKQAKQMTAPLQQFSAPFERQPVPAKP